MSTNELEKNTNISIYPNQTNDQLTIIADGTIEQILIHNTNGELVHKSTHNTLFNVNEDLSELQSGVYFIFIQSDKGMNTFKIVKK